jgi:hypothetical protein
MSPPLREWRHVSSWQYSFFAIRGDPLDLA